MKILFVSWEYFGFHGLYGGFGRLTRTLAEEMVKRGHEVHAFTPHRKNNPGMKLESHAEINGVQVQSFDSRMRVRFGIEMLNPPTLPDVDVVHDQEPGAWSKTFAEQTPDSVHLVTSQDPRTIERLRETYLPIYPHMRTVKWRVKYALKEWLCRQHCHRADMVYAQAKFIRELAQKHYHLDYTPPFLPNPVELKNGKIEKADEPTIMFMARWDPVKRPDIFVEVAKLMPDLKFIGCGVANPESEEYGTPIIEEAKRLPNLDYMGYVTADKKREILEKSWIMLNCSTSECLPVAYLEASGYGQAIVSPNNPDSFASQFGMWIHPKLREDPKAYVQMINCLLENDLWRQLGKEGREYVEKTHEINKVIDQHLKEYRLWKSDKETSYSHRAELLEAA